MTGQLDTKRMRTAAALLPEPGDRVIVECLDEIEKLRTALAEALGGWRPISEAPKMRALLVAYRNKLGKWRMVRAQCYLPDTLEWGEEQQADAETDFAPEGWYELCESSDTIYPVEGDPELFCEIPAIPPEATP